MESFFKKNEPNTGKSNIQYMKEDKKRRKKESKVKKEPEKKPGIVSEIVQKLNLTKKVEPEKTE